VTAGVIVKFGLSRLPAGVPDRITVLNIEIVSVGILWGIVVTESGEPEELGVFVETVTASGVGYDRKEFFASQIIDPGERSPWGGNDVFFIHVVKITVFHGNLLLVMIGTPDYNRRLMIKNRLKPTLFKDNIIDYYEKSNRVFVVFA
jgi:hypothetical protein